MLQIQSPFPQFTDLDGSPLDDGSVHLGVAGQNPETNPLPVYWDDAGTMPAAQPLKTSSGYIVRAGAPAVLYTSQTEVSMTVRNKKGLNVFSTLNARSWYAGALTDIPTVRDFGAIGDYNLSTSSGSDDTTAFLNAVAWSRTNRRSILVPGVAPGYAYQVNSTLDLTAGDYYGGCLIGENPEASKIITGVTGTTPLILMTGGSGTATNAAAQNLRLIPKVAGQGVAVRINGNDFGKLDNLFIDNFNYGIHLLNGTGVGTFTELTCIDRIWVNYCNSNIKLEVGAGDASMHGTSMTNVFMNIGSGQIGLDIGPNVFLYNSYLQIHFWGYNNATFIKNLGNCNDNTVDFTFEGTNGKLDIQERFHASGWLNGIGAIQDISTSLPGTGKGFLVDNYFKQRTPTDANLVALGISSIQAMSKNAADVNGMSPAIVRLKGSNIESVGINVFHGGGANGLAIMGTPFQGDIGATSLYHLLGNAGWTSFLSALPMAIGGQPAGTQFQLNSTGLHSGKMGKSVAGSVSANAGVPQTITVASANYATSTISELLSFRIAGTNFEWRGLFVCNHEGYGGVGAITQIATFYTINGTGGGCVYPSAFGIDTTGKFKFTITTDRALSYTVKNIGVSDY